MNGQTIDKALEYVTKGALLATFVIPTFIVIETFFFPFVTGRVYYFRLFVEISLFFWLILIARKPEFRPRLRSPLILGLLLFTLGLLVTAFFGVDITHSFFSNIERSDGLVQYIHWVLYFLMIASTFRTLREWKIFLWVFTAVSTAVALYAWNLHEPRLAGLFNNPSYLAAYMLFAIGVAAYLWIQTVIKNNQDGGKKLWWHLLFAALIIFFLTTIIFTQTRGVYLGFTVGFILFSALVAFFLRKERRKLTIVAATLSLILIASIGSIFLFKDSGVVTGNQILNRIADTADLANAAAVRERYLGWIIALESFKDKPVFGWGPENYDIAFNEHYNYLAAKDESWFDSSHNQLLDTLAEGGIFGFALYLFWIGAVFYTGWRLVRQGRGKDKLIGAVLAGTFLAFLVQGWFLFDTFPFYLGLFPFLAFAYYKYEKLNGRDKTALTSPGKALPLSGTYALALILLLLTPYLAYKNFWEPHRINSLLFQYQRYLNSGQFVQAKTAFEAAKKINSPYLNFDVGNQATWSLLYVMDNPLPQQVLPQAYELYKSVTEREEQSLARYRPLEPQVFYALGRLYRLGSEQFGIKEHLVRAEEVLKAGRAVSPGRAEYVNELADVLILEGRPAEAEAMVLEHLTTIPVPYSDVTLGHFYFTSGRYDLAYREYKEAQAGGFKFWENDINYSRYLTTAEQMKDYQSILDLSNEYLSHHKPSADVIFNQAVAYYYLGNKEEAMKAYLKTIALDRNYERYASFFITQ